MKDLLKFALLSAGESPMNIAAKVDIIAEYLLAAAFLDCNDYERYYSIYGKHNKPTVTYIGNGSDERRFVNVGGIGKLVYIESSESGVFALVTKMGAIIKKGSSLDWSDGASWYEPTGTIEFNAVHDAFNKSGVAYTATLL